MNKDEFIKTVWEYDITGTMNSIRMTERVVNQVLNALQRAIVEHGSLKFTGLGVFEVVDVPARQCRNPQNGEPITIPAHKAVRFRPGKELKEAVNRE